MSKHTPGPWEFAKGKSNVTLAGSWAEDESLGSIRSATGWYLAKLEGSLPGGEVEQLANAHLIAAAPDLLHCVSNLLGMAIRDGWKDHKDVCYRQAHDFLLDAISKVEAAHD